MEFTDAIGAAGIFHDEENLPVWLEKVKEGQILQGYLGTYGRVELGQMEYNFHFLANEDGDNEVIGIDSHATGDCIWHVLFADAHFLGEEEGEDNEEDVLSKCVFCTSPDEEDESCIPVTLVHADVLPCYSPGEPVAMQVAAFPDKINYYPDEETCDRATMVENAGGLKFVFGNGRMLTLYGIDTMVKGVVKSVEHHETVTFVKGEPEKRTYCYVVVDTQFGPLPLCHSEEMVPEGERQWIREGACLMTNCVISGDVAIGEYKDGAVYDEIHDLKLLRHCLVAKDFWRAWDVFANDAVYISDDFGKRAESWDAVLEKLQSLADQMKKDENIFNRTWLVRVDSYEGEKEENRKYLGHPALAYCQYEKEGLDSLMFVETNEDGKIARLYVSRDKGFRVTPITFRSDEDFSVLQPILSEKNRKR